MFNDLGDKIKSLAIILLIIEVLCTILCIIAGIASGYFLLVLVTIPVSIFFAAFTILCGYAIGEIVELCYGISSGTAENRKNIEKIIALLKSGKSEKSDNINKSVTAEEKVSMIEKETNTFICPACGKRQMAANATCWSCGAKFDKK